MKLALSAFEADRTHCSGEHGGSVDGDREAWIPGKGVPLGALQGGSLSESPCCMDRRYGRIEPYPCSGLCGADILGASEVQHSVQHVGGDGHLSRLSPVGLEA